MPEKSFISFSVQLCSYCEKTPTFCLMYVNVWNQFQVKFIVLETCRLRRSKRGSKKFEAEKFRCYNLRTSTPGRAMWTSDVQQFAHAAFAEGGGPDSRPTNLNSGAQSSYSSSFWDLPGHTAPRERERDWFSFSFWRTVRPERAKIDVCENDPVFRFRFRSR